MIMNPGMLLFGLIDSGVAFFLVYYIVKARFGGNQKAIARILAAILGTLVFTIYFAVIVWFNTATYSVAQEIKMVVYLAPFVLSALMTALVLLSQPPKEKEKDEAAEEIDKESEENDTASETEKIF